jgi:deltex-like protein
MDNNVDDAMSSSKVILADSAQTCAVCLDSFVNGGDESESCVKLSKCNHVFHPLCCRKMLEATGKCAVCQTFYVIKYGTMPYGKMTVTSISDQALGGYPSGSGTITFTYSIPSGIQSSEHPNPGMPFTGTTRTCFLPNTAEGREALSLLETAFQRRLTFCVGTSLTTGQENTVVWASIHHKTSMHGGPTAFGFPDDTYLERLFLELSINGIFRKR